MNDTLDRLLSAYLDGTLSPARRAAVEKRLAEPRVAKRLAQLKALDQAVRGSAVQPSAVQSRRMWMAIAAQVQAQAPAAREPWYAFLQRRWFGAGWAYSLAGAAAVLLVVLLIKPAFNHAPGEGIQAPATPVPPSVGWTDAARAPRSPGEVRALEQAQAASNQAAAKRSSGFAPAPAAEAPAPAAAAPAAAASAAVAAAPAAEAAAPAPRAARSEVERALAENPVDGLIERFLAERPQALQPMPSRARRSLAPAATMAAYGDAAPMEESVDSSAMMAAQGGTDEHGFWDWRAAGLALNQHDWQQARVELEAARAKARQVSERAFAASALTLLSAAGQPLQGSATVLPQSGELRVLGAGIWQLQLDSRLARFSRGYSAHLPGFRVEGDTLLLDMTFDRASFSPGARFTRVSGETPARVLDAASQPVESSDFVANEGADYNAEEKVLHLR